MKSQIARKEFAPGTSRGPRSDRTLALQMVMEAEKQAAVGRRLKELRGARTQQPIADHVGVTLRAYQAWEAGDSGISWPHIEKLAAYHGVSENFILYGSDNAPAMRANQLDRIEAKLDRLLELNGEPEVPASAREAAGVVADAVPLSEAIESRATRTPGQSRSQGAGTRRKRAS